MTIQPTETQATYRDAMIDKLAQRLYAAHGGHNEAYMEANWPMISLSYGAAWKRAAEAAVDELIDRPEREFQSRLAELLDNEPPVTSVDRQWQQATADDWMPGKSCPTRLMDGRNEIRCWLAEGHAGDCK